MDILKEIDKQIKELRSRHIKPQVILIQEKEASKLFSKPFTIISSTITEKELASKFTTDGFILGIPFIAIPKLEDGVVKVHGWGSPY